MSWYGQPLTHSLKELNFQLLWATLPCSIRGNNLDQATVMFVMCFFTKKHHPTKLIIRNSYRRRHPQSV